MKNKWLAMACILLCVPGLLAGVCAPTRASDSPQATTPAQDFPDELTRRKLEKWDRDSEKSLRSHLKSVASRGDADSLLAAALLWPVGDEPPRQSEDEKPQVWFAKLASLTPRTPTVAWVQANGCLIAETSACGAEQGLDFLLETEPGNAAVQLLAMHRADDEGEIERSWLAAVDADRYDYHTHELGVLLLKAVETLTLPPMNPNLAEAMGEALGLNRPITGRDARSAFAASVWMTHAIPNFASIRERCEIKNMAALDSTRREQCMKIFALLETDQSTAITPMISLVWQVMLGGETPYGIAARERLRQLHWLYENGSIMPQSAQRGSMADDYVDTMLLHGELAAMRLVLKSKNLSATAPDSWLPARENARSLVVSGKKSENL